MIDKLPGTVIDFSEQAEEKRSHLLSRFLLSQENNPFTAFGFDRFTGFYHSKLDKAGVGQHNHR